MIDGREKDFIKTDEEKRKLINAAGGEKEHKGADIVVVFDHTWGHVDVSGLGNLYTNRMVKILTEKGAAQQSVLRFDYDPRSYLNNVLRLRIHRLAGGVEELDPGDCRDVMQPEAMLYWRVKMKLYSLRNLQVGDAVEYEVFKKGFNVAYLKSAGDRFDPDSWVDPETGIKPPMYGAFYDIVYFREKVPIKEKRYTVLSPKRMPLSFEFYRGDCRSCCLVDDEYYTYSFEKKDIEGYTPEMRMPGIQTSMPKLLLSSIHDWREKSRWFYRMNETQFEWNEDIKKVVNEVTAGCATDDEKAAALLHWVAQEIRYIGFSVAQGEGYTIHPGIMTFRERGGVCKEYGGMLVTMLRAAGLEAYAAQTQALAPVNRIPADQFDHCVTAWLKPDGSFTMLDPTWAPFSMQIWDAAESTQNFLIGSPEGENLGVSTTFTPEDSRLNLEATSTISPEGMLTGSVSYWGRGRSDSTQRFMHSWQPAAAHDRLFQKMMSELDPAVEITGRCFTDIMNLKESFRSTLEYRVPKYALVNQDTMYLRLPLMRLLLAPNLVRYLTAADTPERKFDMMVIFLQLAEASETITVPAGWRLASRPVAMDLKNDSVELAVNLKQEVDELRFSLRFMTKERYVTPDTYKAFREITGHGKNLAERWLVLRKEQGGKC
ncbi:DUF3857 domain-containing protein [bacterium]|nr:DUF3857 domain-containing protein [candidate division CSSED10-310 bacterium]